MPPPPTPTGPPNRQSQTSPQGNNQSLSTSSTSSLPPSLLSTENATNQRLTSFDHIQRFGNASTNQNPDNEYSIDMAPEYMYRNLHADSNNVHPNNEAHANFRSSIVRQLTDMHRLQSRFNQLYSNREQSNRAEHELAINSIPIQLRNISRELTRNLNREAYFVETTDDDDQSFQEEDEPEVIYYSEDNGNAIVYLESNESELSDDESAAVRHDIRNNERNILASGRNSGYPYRFTSTRLNNSGVPLRRQNAIRARFTHKRKASDDQEKSNDEKSEGNSYLLQDEAKSLLEEIHTFYEDLISLDEFQGESPLFRKLYHEKDDPFRPFFLTDPSTHFRSEDTSTLHLDNKMDAYLQKRRNNQLWLKLRLPPPPPRATSLKDKKRSINSRLSFSTSAKRQKLVHNSNDEVAMYTEDIPHGRYLYSKKEKESILTGLSSSLFKSGSVYYLGADHNPLNKFKLVIGDIDGSINGVFNFAPENTSPLESILLKLNNFTKFICGFNDFSQCLPRSKILVRKLNVLDRISIDKNVSYKKNLKDDLNFPILGHVVDFKEYDLRFLKSTPNESSSSRFRSKRVILQLLEWMKLHPFIQFKENYFLSTLRKLDKTLSNFEGSKLRTPQKVQILNWTRELKSNLCSLTKDFTFMNDNNINKVKLIRDQNFKKQSIQPYVSLFVDEWEKILACELSEQITKEESTTLLNIQLNFILFTLEIDLSKFLDSFIEYIFRHCYDSRYMDNYRKVYDNVLADEHKETENHKATLICSIDRKTGTIEILNTLPFLHYKDRSSKRTGFILSTDLNLSDYSTRSSFVYDDFELFEGDKVPQNSSTFNTSINLGGLNHAIVDTKLTGSFEFEESVCDMV